MKKITIKSLKLNKKDISNLHYDAIKSGAAGSEMCTHVLLGC